MTVGWHTVKKYLDAVGSDAVPRIQVALRDNGFEFGIARLPVQAQPGPLPEQSRIRHLRVKRHFPLHTRDKACGGLSKRGNSVGEHLIQAPLERLAQHFSRMRRHMHPDQHDGRFPQDAGGFTVAATLDYAALRVRGVCRDAGNGQRPGVGPGAGKFIDGIVFLDFSIEPGNTQVQGQACGD